MQQQDSSLKNDDFVAEFPDNDIVAAATSSTASNQSNNTIQTSKNNASASSSITATSSSNTGPAVITITLSPKPKLQQLNNSNDYGLDEIPSDDHIDEHNSNHMDDSIPHVDDNAATTSAVPAAAPTPLPYKKLFIVFSILFCEAFTGGSIFPYVGFMIRDFKLTDDEEKIGYYAGVLASSYFVAQLFSSYMWGYLSDKYGRRPIIL